MRTTLETYGSQWGAAEFFACATSRGASREPQVSGAIVSQSWSGGRGGRKGGYLLDLKLAGPSTLQSVVRAADPAWPSEADRVVAIERTMQAAPPAFLRQS